MNQERLGQRLKAAREQARLKQNEAAERLGVTPAALNQYEAGTRRVDALTLEALGRLYGVPLRFFFEDVGSEEEWEERLRGRAEGLSPAGKVGISRLLERVRAFVELYERTETPFPTEPHPPFRALPDAHFANDDVADLAEDARRHFDLGTDPVNVRDFLEANGYLVFAVPFGREDGSLSGLSFRHPSLGSIVAINENEAYSRYPFTLAHELAHRLYHHDRPAVLSRHGDTSPIEAFADRFAAHFLVPSDALHKQLRLHGMPRVEEPETIVHLARYFGISYKAMKSRLKSEGRLGPAVDTQEVKPLALAWKLGYRPSPEEFGARPLPVEDRVPRRFLELARRAVDDDRISLGRAADMLGVSGLELEERFYTDPVPEEFEDYG